MAGPGVQARRAKGEASRARRRDDGASPRAFVLAVLVLAGSAFFLVWSWIAVGPAAAYQAGTTCAADAAVNAQCRTVGVDTVQRVTYSGTTQGRITLLLAGHGRVPGGSVTGSLATGTKRVPKAGESVNVVAWQGYILTASGDGFSGTGGASPVHELTVVLFCALGLLGAGLAIVHLSLKSGGYRARGLLRHAQRNGLVVIAAGFAVHLLGDSWYGVGAATVGTLWILAWCAAAGHAVFTEAIEAVQRQGPLPETWAEVRAARRAARPRGDGCPVGEQQQAWIEQSMLWFTTQFGYDPVQNPTVLPTSTFFPQSYTGTDDDVRALVRTVSALMGVLPDRVTVRLIGQRSPDPEAHRFVVHSERFAAGVFEQMPDGAFVVELDRASAGDQARMTAVIAHELGHVRLIGEGRVDPARKDQEPLTDLATVFFGLGIFNANAARIPTATAAGYSVTRLGYLDQRMFGYALACYARMRHTPAPKWAQYLSPMPLEYMDQGIRYLQAARPHGGFPTEGVQVSEVK